MSRLLRFAPVLFALIGAAMLLPSRGATVPLYAARTGLQCGTCHFDPNGGGGRNEFGFAFAKDRHAIEPETEGEFKDLALRNRAGDDLPLYFGLNQRFMLLADHIHDAGPLETSGFFNMESGLHVTFQPVSRLTMSYSLVTTPGGTSTRDAWGMINFGSHYLRAGQFRVPFGLRMDDHTVSTRNSFLDYYGVNAGSRGQFLPYDPRTSDRGVEFGASYGNFFGRTSWTNGSTSATPPIPGRHPQAIAAKLGYAMSAYQGGLSVYDEWHPTGAMKSARASRWGYYGMGRVGPVALLGEVAVGTDRSEDTGVVTEKNSLAYWAEADYSPLRQYNVRVRYDRLNLDRSTDKYLRKLNSYDRIALEGEYVPVPFAEIRWTFRIIHSVADRNEFNEKLPTEKQGYIQVHFSY